MTQNRIIIATGNAHKVEEMRALCGPAWQVQSMQELSIATTWEETGSTFAANARIKVAGLAEHAPPTAFLLADDSGLSVEPLNGAPGVYSARYAGPNAGDADNNQLLLRDLRNLPQPWLAAFHCCLALRTPSGTIHEFHGALPGRIVATARGQHGFGYDPLFVPEGFEQTLAELGPDTKNKISHRARAMADCQKFLATQVT